MAPKSQQIMKAQITLKLLELTEAALYPIKPDIVTETSYSPTKPNTKEQESPFIDQEKWNELKEYLEEPKPSIDPTLDDIALLAQS